MKKYTVEFIGTFFLVVTIILAANANLSGGLVPLAIGLLLMGMIYAGGYISMAHYNPVVTLSFWLRGRMPRADLPGYWLGQLLATVLATGLGIYLVQFGWERELQTAQKGLNFGPALVAEFLGTFALVWVILHVATAKGTAGNQSYGLAIAATVVGAAYSLGGISGAALNPAVALALCATGMVRWSDLPTLLLGQVLGGITATYAFLFVNRD